MGVYVIKSGQNLYDVSLCIYGSVEGVADLLMCNEGLSFESVLRPGDVLSYSDRSVIDALSVRFYAENRIVPSNDEGDIYFKGKPTKERVLFVVDRNVLSFELKVSGAGTLFIDWGDNSALETVVLSTAVRVVRHVADSVTRDLRRVVFYGDCSFERLDASGMKAQDVFMMRPLECERFGWENGNSACLTGLGMLKGTAELSLCGSQVPDLMFVIELEGLSHLDLRDCGADSRVVDNCLMSLVRDYRSRRDCEVILTGNELPGGAYQRPGDLQNPDTGFGALWVLVNERSWRFVTDKGVYEKSEV